MTVTSLMKPIDRWIPLYFVLFFLVVAAVDSVFVYLAVSTQTGTVTDRSYENGLAFNEILAAAARQDALGIHQQATFDNGELIWILTQKDGTPLAGAQVTVRLIRPVQGGHDFTVSVPETLTSGVYRTTLNLPMPGEWTARLKAQWDNNTYQTNLPIINR